MLTREQIEEIQTESREKGIPVKNLFERKMYSRSPVLLVETQIQQTGSSGGVPSCSMRWSADNNPVKENRLYSYIYARFLVPLHIESRCFPECF